MSYSIPTLLTRNLHDVFGENDPARRRAAIDEIHRRLRVLRPQQGSPTIRLRGAQGWGQRSSECRGQITTRRPSCHNPMLVT